MEQKKKRTSFFVTLVRFLNPYTSSISSNAHTSSDIECSSSHSIARHSHNSTNPHSPPSFASHVSAYPLSNPASASASTSAQRRSLSNRNQPDFSTSTSAPVMPSSAKPRSMFVPSNDSVAVPTSRSYLTICLVAILMLTALLTCTQRPVTSFFEKPFSVGTTLPSQSLQSDHSGHSGPVSVLTDDHQSHRANQHTPPNPPALQLPDANPPAARPPIARPPVDDSITAPAPAPVSAPSLTRGPWTWPENPVDGPFHAYMATTRVQVGDDPHLFNSRTYAIARDVCIKSIEEGSTESHFYVDESVSDAPNCSAVKTDLKSPTDHPNNFCSLISNNVVCGHGVYYTAGFAYCPTVHPFAQGNTLPHVERIESDAVVVVPAIMFLGNVYHFSFVAANTIYITSQLPTMLRRYYGPGLTLPPDGLRVTILFRGGLPEENGLWQEGLVNAMIKHRLNRLNMSVTLDTLHERTKPDKRTLCMRNGVFLGKRRALALWPFPNVTSITSADGDALHADAIAFRWAAYKAADIPTALPDFPGLREAENMPSSAWSDLPGRIIGYARRNTVPDPPPGINKIDGTTRRFSDADEEWFVSTLKALAKERGFEYRTLQATKGMTFEQQVRLYADVGVLVGIHGANFVNGIFARPFSAIFEITPVSSPCYLAGANSGLRYWRYVPKRAGTVEESYCSSKSCRANPKMHRVVIGHPDDHENIVRNVREMMDYIDSLYEQHLSAEDWENVKSQSSRIQNSNTDVVPMKLGRIPISYDASTFSYRRPPLTRETHTQL